MDVVPWHLFNSFNSGHVFTCVRAFTSIQKPNALSKVVSCPKSTQLESSTSPFFTREKVTKDLTGWIIGSIGLLTTSPDQRAWASLDDPSSDASSTFLVSSLFDDIQTELTSPTGGISYLQSCIDKKDFASILEFTKVYDLDFRKEKMGKTRQSLQD